MLRMLPVAGPAIVLVIALLIARRQVVLVQKIPTPIFWAIIVAILLSVLVALLVRWLRERREAEAVKKGLFEQGEASAQSARADLQNQMKEINTNLSSALARLETGPEGKKTLYAIPWYLILGPSGCGKTTAIKNSGLQFPGLSQAEMLQGTGGTRNCNWWLSAEAIIVDTAGRYVSASDRAETQEEWLEFLDLIRRHRKHSPLNGLIVAYSIDDLIQRDEATLVEEAGALRERLDEIMNRLQWAFPTYMVFMKCDLVDGFVEFFRTLPPGARSRAWGGVYPIIDGTDQKVAERFTEKFHSLVDRLRGHRAAAVSPEAQTGGNWAKAMMFPERFAALEGKLALFLDTLFRPNPYARDFPRLRGTFYTSGMQEGAPIDQVIEEIERIVGARGRTDSTERTPTSDAYFVNALFTRYLRADRDLARRTQASTARQKKKRFVMTVATGVVSILCCVWTTVSCGLLQAKIQGTAEVGEELQTDFRRDEPSEDLDRLDALGEQVNGSWDVFPLAIALRAKGAAQRVYEEESRRRVLVPLERATIRQAQTARQAERLRGLLRTELLFGDPDHEEGKDFDLGAELEKIAQQERWMSGAGRDAVRRLAIIAREYRESGEPLVSLADAAEDETDRERALRAAARELVRSHDPRELLDQLIEGASAVARDLTLDDLGGSGGTGGHMESRKVVRAAFTRSGWQEYLASRIRAVEVTMRADNRLVSLIGETPSSISDVRDQVVRSYVADLSREWGELFSSVSMGPSGGCSRSLEVVEALANTVSSPFLEVLRTAEARTRFTVGPERVSPEDERADPIAEARLPLNRIIENIDALGEALASLQAAVAACADGGAYGADLDAGKRGIRALQRLLDASRLGQGLSAYLELPLQYATTAIRSNEVGRVRTSWRNDVIGAWDDLRDLYPFRRDATREAGVADVCAFFGHDGALDRFLAYARAQNAAPGSALGSAIDRLDAVRKNIDFGTRSIQIPFRVTLAPDASSPYGVSAVRDDPRGEPNVRSVEGVTIWIQGEQVTSLGPSRTARFTWNTDAEEPSSALEVRVGRTVRLEPTSGASAWSWFRLYDMASVTPQGANDHLSWTVGELGVQIEALVLMQSGRQNMFGAGAPFRGFALPEDPFSH